MSEAYLTAAIQKVDAEISNIDQIVANTKHYAGMVTVQSESNRKLLDRL